MTERHASAGRDVVEINVLLAFTVRVGVVEYPLLVGHVGVMTVDGYDIRCHNVNFVGAFSVELELIT